MLEPWALAAFSLHWWYALLIILQFLHIRISNHNGIDL